MAFSDGKVGLSVSSVEERKEPLENFVFIESDTGGKMPLFRSHGKVEKTGRKRKLAFLMELCVC